MPACKKPVCLEQFECVRQQSTVHLQLKRRSVSNSLVPAGSVSETFMLQEPDLPFVVSAEAEKGSILPIQSSSVCAHRFHLAIHDFQLLLERSPLCMSMRVDALSGMQSPGVEGRGHMPVRPVAQGPLDAEFPCSAAADKPQPGCDRATMLRMPHSPDHVQCTPSLTLDKQSECRPSGECTSQIPT
jgi:hypothetical protein